MRIIAGFHRGRKILSPADDLVTRPYTDRVKQALFDRLASAGRMEGAHVLDIFCGTGQMGLECLSREAASVTFIDRDRDAVDRLKQNIATLKEGEGARVLSIDALGSSLVSLLPRNDYDLIFFDPPYAMLSDERRERIDAQMVALAHACAPGAWLIFRGPSKGVEVKELAPWQGPVSWPYGSMVLHKYELSGVNSKAQASFQALWDGEDSEEALEDSGDAEGEDGDGDEDV